jgi:hypothetical protein
LESDHLGRIVGLIAAAAKRSPGSSVFNGEAIVV